MDFEFVSDENYLAYFILNRLMYNESKEIMDIKKKLFLDNALGYKKITNQQLLDLSIYIKDDDTKKLINEFISTDVFNEIYKTYNNESKEEVAIKILIGIINFKNNELEKVKDELWDKYLNSYSELLRISCYNPRLFLLDKDIIKMINEFKETDEFRKLYDETNNYLINVKKYLNKNKAIINNYLKKVLKIDFDIKPKVYITHPNTCGGFTFDNNIVWGHYKGIEEPCYNIVYLVHEGMHCLLPFESNESNDESYIKHSIIELISDYELYSLLKGESTINEGHPYLTDYRNFLYPYWLKYIGLNEDQLKERLDKDNIDKYVSVEDDLSNMNIKEFINYCNKKYSINKNSNRNK